MLTVELYPFVTHAFNGSRQGRACLVNDNNGHTLPVEGERYREAGSS